MRHRISIILPILLIAYSFSLQCYSQVNNEPYSFWNQQPLHGELTLRGIYRTQSTFLRDIEEDQISKYFNGGIKLNTSAFIFKPDIIKIYAGGEFNPESRDEKYLIVPDRTETRTLSKIDLRASIFNNKVINLNTYLNINNNYFNREYLTNIKSANKQWGGIIGFNNKILPASISFRKTSWNQDEIQSGRNFSMDQSNIEGRLSKSFSSYDRSELRVSYDDNKYDYNQLSKTNNTVKKLNFNNSTWFDSRHRYSLYSTVIVHKQEGTYNFAREEAIERLTLLLPQNLRFNSGYNFIHLSDTYQSSRNNRANLSLSHQLFESLYTNVYADFSAINHTVYKENDLKGGVNFKYTKRIKKSRLNLSYNYFRHNSEINSSASNVYITNEPHSLSDGEVTILDKPYIDQSTITVMDITGTIVFQENLDYILSERGDFIEITRIPGGLITDGTNIMVNYTSTQPGSYAFHANNNSVGASISFYNNLIEFYYRGSAQSYPYVIDTEFLTLNRYHQNIYGARINLPFANGGVEYDSYNSNIIPYKRTRYFLSINQAIKSKIIVSLNCNINDYRVIDEMINQLYSSVNGRLAYNIRPGTRVSAEAGYLSQTGKNIDLKLFTSRAEISHSIRRFTARAGFEMYRRHYLESDIYYTGTYIQLTRKF